MKIIVSCRARGLVLATALGIGLGFATHASALDYSYLIDLNSKEVTNLGNHVGAVAINDSGQVIGASNRGAFITGPNGVGMTFLGHSATANGINASGQVVGSARIDERAPDRPFITGPNGVGMTALGPYFSAANGINASGQMVGGASYGGTNPHGYAFISGPNGGLYDLNVGIMDASAKAINDAGQVIGESDRGAFITGPNGGGVTYLDSLGGGQSYAHGINASGQVVGRSNSAAGYPHAFITGPDGVGMTDLGTLGGNRSEAFGINDAGEVVGQSYAPDGHGYAFITGPNGVGMTYLGALVDLPTGAVLTSAADINNMGQVIVSASIVPEPESYALMLAGLALMGAVVRRQRG